MNYDALVAELQARGFDYLTTARAGQMINDAVQELDEMYTWPYRETTATGAAPLSITDLGTIEEVLDPSQNSMPLTPRTYQWLADTFGDLTVQGNPAYYYVDWTSGSAKVAVYPASTHSLSVRYWKITPTLSTGQTPLAPDRFHQIYLKIAQRMAEAERGNQQIVAALQGEIDRMVGRMVAAIMGGQQIQGPGDITRVWSADDR